MKKNVFIIAEAGVNHNGSIVKAKKLIDIAKKSGADAIKFQSFNTNEITTKYSKKAKYQIISNEKSETQAQMLKKLELSKKAHFILKDYCRHKKIEFMSTAFDIESLEFLIKEIKIKRIKIASGEITNALLLKKCAESKCKIILSTGMSDINDIKNALKIIAHIKLNKSLDSKTTKKSLSISYNEAVQKNILNKYVSLLHATTEYPVPFNQVNLLAMKTIKKVFGLEIGYSDHTNGIAIPIAAVSLGATIIEKHFTINKNLPGPDHKASLAPEELYEMVKNIRDVEKSFGSYNKEPTKSEIENSKVIRKSIVAKRDIEIGELFNKDNICIKRPGTGLSPMNYWNLIGKKSKKKYFFDEIIYDD